jgi:Transcriptional regulators
MSLERPKTLTTAVAAYIRDAIVHGEFAPGSRLPEVALATQLETSRGTVREALRTLADGGLIQVIPRRGVFVSQLSVRATWEITSLRALLEPYASRLALGASGADPAMRVEVEAAFEVLRDGVKTGDPVTVADADVAFHRSVFARCRHEMLLSQLETLQALSRRIVLTNQVVSADAPTLIAQHAPNCRGGGAARPGAPRNSGPDTRYRRRGAAHDPDGGARVEPCAASSGHVFRPRELAFRGEPPPEAYRPAAAGRSLTDGAANATIVASSSADGWSTGTLTPVEPARPPRSPALAEAGRIIRRPATATKETDALESAGSASPVAIGI